MEIDKPSDLQFVEDDFEEGAHEKLDEQIRRTFKFPHIAPQHFDLSPFLLISIAQKSGSRLLANYLNILECETIVESEPRLRSMLLDGWKNGYKSVRLLSKDLSVSIDCTSDAPIVELLRPGEHQSKILLKSHYH